MKSSAEWLKHVRKHVDIHAMDSTEMAAVTADIGGGGNACGWGLKVDSSADGDGE